MKILIIGAKGTLGQALVQEFSNHEVLAWDREEIDITDFEPTSQKLKAEKPDIIINAAAMTDVDACETNIAAAQKLNGDAPKHLAQLANELDATLVQYSTSYIFDGSSKDGYAEGATPHPISVYGQTKLSGEHSAMLARKHYILRLDRLFGRSGGGKKSFVDKMLEATATKKKLSIIDDEEGNPTYAPDIAARTRYILENKLPYGIYHTTNEGSCSWYEWAKEIFKIRGIAVELERAHVADFPRKAKRPQYAHLINTKLPPMRSWQAALKEYLAS